MCYMYAGDVLTHVLTCMQERSCTHKHTDTVTYMHAHAHADAHVLTDTENHAHTLTDTGSHMATLTCAPVHTHTCRPHPPTPVSTQPPLVLPGCHLGTHGSPLQFVDIQPNDGFGTILPLETLELDVIFQPLKAKAKEYRFELICKSVINR